MTKVYWNFFVFINLFPWFSWAQFYAGKLQNKEIQLWLNNYQSSGFLSFSNENQIYKLLRQTDDSEQQLIFKFKVTPENSDRFLAIVELRKNQKGFSGKWIEDAEGKKNKSYFSLEEKSTAIQEISTKEITFTNEKCDFEYFDLNAINDVTLLNRIYVINQKIMTHYRDLGCKLQEPKKMEKATDIASVKDTIEKNNLACKSEIFLYKNRFYGINIYCQGRRAGVGEKTIKKNFIELYDKNLKLVVKKQDFTDSDIKNEDDNLAIMFGLSSAGIFLYFDEPTENVITYQSHIPFKNLRKNFEKWGVPKSYLRYFEPY